VDTCSGQQRRHTGGEFLGALSDLRRQRLLHDAQKRRSTQRHARVSAAPVISGVNLTA
jgi:hypothetical protein